MRFRVRAGSTLACLALTLLSVSTIPARAGYAQPSPDQAAPQPVSTHPMPDPGVILNGSQFVALSTGSGLQESTAPTAGGPWTTPTDQLGALPPWTSSRGIWAPDIVHVDSGWVVYFSAVVTPKAGA